MGGGLQLKPGEDEWTIDQAATFLKVTHKAAYMLWRNGFIEGRQPSPRFIYLKVSSVREHHRKTSEDPYFWDAAKSLKNRCTAVSRSRQKV